MTVPSISVAPPSNRTQSPTPYCFSLNTKNPAIKSAIIDWAPKPRAADAAVAGMVAPASEKPSALNANTKTRKYATICAKYTNTPANASWVFVSSSSGATILLVIKYIANRPARGISNAIMSHSPRVRPGSTIQAQNKDAMVDRGIMFEHSEDLKKGYKCSTTPTPQLNCYITVGLRGD